MANQMKGVATDEFSRGLFRRRESCAVGRLKGPEDAFSSLNLQLNSPNLSPSSPNLELSSPNLVAVSPNTERKEADRSLKMRPNEKFKRALREGIGWHIS
jgi:hypothetical protein